MGRSRGGLTKTIHAVVDADGRPIRLTALDEETIAAFARRAADPEGNGLTMDLAQRIEARDGFGIAASRRETLLRGLDAIGSTLDHADEIRTFEARHRASRPWLA